MGVHHRQGKRRGRNGFVSNGAVSARIRLRDLITRVHTGFEQRPDDVDVTLAHGEEQRRELALFAR